MEIDDIDVFAEVIRCQSISDAAEFLKLTMPPHHARRAVL